MKKSPLILLFGLLSWFASIGQDQSFLYKDHTYLDNIRSVKFFLGEVYISYPIIRLGSGQQLTLIFDDLSTNAKYYTYRLIHCDKDWRPSNLSELEYLEGFSGERIDDFQYSFKTRTPFVNYQLKLPNEDITWTKSGNYLLVVFDADRGQIPAFTRRFVVVEDFVRIQPAMTRPAVVGKSRTHHEIDFLVNHEYLDIRNPRAEVSATILQNGRWDNAMQGLAPFLIKGKSLVFDYTDQIVFPAGKEFRYLDMRSLRFGSENISTIETYEDGFEVMLFRDNKRLERPTVFRNDLNGNFVIETTDQRDFDLSSDYAQVLFSLYSPTVYDDHDLYVVGGFNGWQLKPENKMVYNNSVNGYVAKILLKQGYYDYAYALVPRSGSVQQLNTAEIEGDWFETNNDYTILIYYKPFGGRYDQVIGSVTFQSGN